MRLQHHFLLSMPSMTEPNFFSHSLTYICEHDENGAMGLMVNRQLDMTVGDIFVQMDIDPGHLEIAHHRAHQGGPVDQERGFVLHSSDVNWDNTLQTGDGICVTSSREILESLAHGDGPKDAIIVLGYAAWTAGQLEHELLQNFWLTCPADSDIIFNIGIDKKLNAAAAKLGIDMSQLSTTAGHA
ncbi:MAG: YqgE/AlgH family protein [Pseudomonadota bacterium]